MKEDFFDAPLVLEFPGTVFYNIQYTGVNYINVLSLKSWKTIIKKHGLNTTSPSFVILKNIWNTNEHKNAESKKNLVF